MRRALLVLVILVSHFICRSEERLVGEAFFQAIQGEWTGTGQLVDADGNATDIQEAWKGQYLDDGSFEMRGSRIWGEDNQEFYWRFTHNESLDLLECEYWHTGVEEPIRLEVSLTETSVEVKAPFGGSGGELVVSNTLSGEAIEGLVSLKQTDGIESLSGAMVHKKKESAE